ncbi:MAG: creatininase family protein [Planctomycetaceae bacterium]
MKYTELTAPELRQLDRDQTLVIVPIAAVEQHGPHLPTGTDSIICTALAEAIESRLQQRTLLLPTSWHGASAHHLRFGATLDSPLDNYLHTLGDLLRSLLRDGFLRIMLLNGHGGNVDPLRVVLRIVQLDFPNALLVGGSYWAGAQDIIERELEGEHRFVGHACEFETSMILYLRPDLVRMEELRDAGTLIPDQIDGLFVSRDMRQRTSAGCTGRPDLATADKGRRLFEAMTERLEATAEGLLREPRGMTFDEFVSADEGDSA